MEQPDSNEEVMRGDINLKTLKGGKTVTRRNAELVKSTEGKNDMNSANKKGSAKNKKNSNAEQPSMVRLSYLHIPLWFFRVLNCGQGINLQCSPGGKICGKEHSGSGLLEIT